MKAPQGEGAKRRTLGFVDSIDSAQRLGTQLTNAEWQELAEDNPARLSAPLYSFRLPVGRPGVELKPAIARALASYRQRQLQLAPPEVGHDCPRRTERNCEQPPHHMLERCERYESGECWFTSAQPREEGLFPIATQTHRSGTRTWGDPRWKYRNEHKDSWRLLISTSALEVGFDHPEIIATWQYHAPPSLASFVQRKGRGGRGVRDYPITMMVLGDGCSDRFAFQHHIIYADPVGFTSYFDPDNPSIRTQHVFSAVLDWCATQRKYETVYKDTRLLSQALREPDARRWAELCFAMPRYEAEQILERLRTYVGEEWDTPLVTPDVGLETDDPLRPFDLLRIRDPARVGRWQQALQGRRGVERTLAWLAAAEHLFAGPNECHSIFDFCDLVPDALVSDHELRVPSSTIPVPVGRHVGVYDRSQAGGRWLADEPSEAALRWFLPGGFKIRYRSTLWMASWRPVAGKAPRQNVAFAATRAQVRVSQVDGACISLGELLRDADLDDDGEVVRQLVGEDGQVAYVTGLEVEPLGTRSQRSFVLEEATLTVLARKPENATGPYTVLTRDPNVTALRFEVPHGNRQWVTLEGGGIIKQIRFYSH
jgi:hypothetical protein